MAAKSCGNLLGHGGEYGGVGGVLRGGAVAFGAGHVEDDFRGLGVVFFGDGGEGAEELVGDVGEDGGGPGGDSDLREKEEEAGEEVVELCGGGEVVEVDSERRGDFSGVGLICGERSVGGAEVGVGGGGVETAASAVGVEMGAASGVV